MYQSFCQCGREHVWPARATAICRCGRVLEPMTQNEFKEAKARHEASLDRIAEALSDLEPVIRFFQE